MGNAHGPSPDPWSDLNARRGRGEGAAIRDGRRLPPSPPLDRSESRMAGLRAREWILWNPGPAPSHPTRAASATVALCRSMLTYRCGGSAGVAPDFPFHPGSPPPRGGTPLDTVRDRGGNLPSTPSPVNPASKRGRSIKKGIKKGTEGFNLDQTVTIARGLVGVCSGYKPRSKKNQGQLVTF